MRELTSDQKHLHAATSGNCCFPMSVDYDTRWDHPHLFAPGEYSADVVWWAVEIAEVDEDSVCLTGAANNKPEEFFSFEVPRADFIKWLGFSHFEQGTFAEIIIQDAGRAGLQLSLLENTSAEYDQPRVRLHKTTLDREVDVENDLIAIREYFRN